MVRTNRNIHFDWIRENNIAEIVEIESHSFPSWTEQQLREVLSHPHCVGMVGYLEGIPRGFMVYELYKHRLDVITLAVHIEHRCQGLGTALINKLKSKLSYEGRPEIVLTICERNVNAQLWLRGQGFVCVDTIPKYYNSRSDDAYLFSYRIDRDVWSRRHTLAR